MSRLAPPTGQLPPRAVELADGRRLDLAAPAVAASDRHLAAHPEELERYGPHTRDWCVHDLQWLLLWAAQDADGQSVDFDAQLDWLARVLDARGYPLDGLADAVATLADEATAVAPGAAARLRAGAGRVRP
jgi:hypothetical protein